MKAICLLSGLALLALSPAAPRLAAQEFFDNVVIVLDASGSMRGAMAGSRVTKMDAAKTALKAVLQQVPQSTHIGLVVFGAGNVQNDWVYPLGPRDDAVLLQAIDRIQPRSGTPLGQYIKKGADRLLEERAKQFGYGRYRLLIVTDGEAQDPDLVNRYTPEVMARGITMDVIGVAMRSAHTLATKVHSYRRADDPESLQRAIREIFAEVGGAAQDAAQAEAFEWLAPIPAGVASAMIQALSTSGNHPIGTRPNAGQRSPTSPRPRATPAGKTTGSTPVRPPVRSSRSGNPLKFLFVAIPGGFCFVGSLVGLFVIVWLVRKGARR